MSMFDVHHQHGNHRPFMCDVMQGRSQAGESSWNLIWHQGVFS